MAESVLIRPRLQSDMDACVSLRVEQSGLLSVALLFAAPPEMATGRLKGRAHE
jgi:hypothetical protein